MSDTTPVYADHSSGEKFDDARSMVNRYLQRYCDAPGSRAQPPDNGSPVALDDSGYLQLRHGSAVLGINVLEDKGVLMIFAPIMQVPVTGREAFYRRLLELSFVATSDAAFAINAPQDEVVVRCLRRLSSLDYEEFEDLVRTVGEIADSWDDRLIETYGT